MPASCDGCSECCKLGIPELSKPVGPWCRYVHHGDFNIKSCSIYAERPPSCRSFECLWLLSQSRPGQAYQPDMRPDRSHVVLVMDIFAIHGFRPRDGDERLLLAHCDPQFPNAWRRGRIKQAIESFLRRGGAVMVLIGSKRVMKRQGSPWKFGGEDDVEPWMAEIPALSPPPAASTSIAVPKLYGVPGGGRPADATFSVPELMRRR